MSATKEKTPLILTIDVGTSSARSSIFDASGERLHETSAQQRYIPRLSADGGAELDPLSLLATVGAVVDQTLASAGSRLGELACVSSGTFWHSLLGVDAAGEPLTPIYLWMDARSFEAAARLRERLNERRVHARTGCMLHWSYPPAKLTHLRETEPALFSRVKRWLSFADFLTERLFGESVTSVSIASASGLFDQHLCSWDAPMLDAVEVDARSLPRIAKDDEWLRGLRSPWAQRWPSLASLPWLPPSGDGALSSVGAGCTTATRAALMVGTSVALRALFPTDEMAIPWGVWGYRLDRRRVCLGGALNDGGSLLDWMRRTLVLPDRDTLETLLAAQAPDAHGLTLLPLWAGERSPGWAGKAHGAIIGLGLHTTPVTLYRAALEAIALRCAQLDELLREAVPTLQHTIATGGALMNSPAWLTIMADAMGRTIVASPEREATSRGAALLALERLGHLPGGLEAVAAPEGATFDPDGSRHVIYRAARSRQRALYEHTVERPFFSGVT